MHNVLTVRDLSVTILDINIPMINNRSINFDINESEMILNEYGIIANNQLKWLEIQYPFNTKKFFLLS